MRIYNVKTTYTNRTSDSGVVAARNRVEALGKIFGQFTNAEYGRTDIARIELTAQKGNA